MVGPVTVASGKPGRSRSEASRQAILEATREELAARGYDKLSLDRIAAAAGVGKQTIYRWYPSKSALVAEGVLSGHLMPHTDVPDSGDLRADVAEWLRAVGRQMGVPETAGLIRATVAATAEDETVAERYDTRVTELTRDALAVRFDRAVAEGELRPDAPIEAAVETLVAAALFRVLTRQSMDDVFVDGVVELVFRGTV